MQPALAGGTVAVLGAILLAGACSQKARPPQPVAQARENASARQPLAQNDVTIRELMQYIVDPAADTLWESVSVVSTQSKTDRRQPRTDKEWDAVRGAAITLMESTNLLVMESRGAAPKGTVPGEGELTPTQIDHAIAANRPAFRALALGLRQAAQNALGAIDSKNAAQLFVAGGDIDEACEACHVAFWYPNQRAGGASNTSSAAFDTLNARDLGKLRGLLGFSGRSGK